MRIGDSYPNLTTCATVARHSPVAGSRSCGVRQSLEPTDASVMLPLDDEHVWKRGNHTGECQADALGDIVIIYHYYCNYLC